MTGRAVEWVTVPDFVGKPVHIGEGLAPKVGVTLTSSNPDGPGIRSLAWPGLFYITSQSPAAGTKLDLFAPPFSAPRPMRSGQTRRRNALASHGGIARLCLTGDTLAA